MRGQASVGKPSESINRYAIYAIAILTAANFLNFVDRFILTILAQSIKADLKLDDAQLGFLMGTAFAVFYAIIGVSVGRIADVVSRTRLMAAGLTFWSAMTMLGSAAVGFGGLALTRIGVSIGEAAATPCGHSLVTQYVPHRHRAAALGVYLTGTFGGVAGAMLLGGMILQTWPQACHSLPVGGACGLAPWRAAFIIVGLPGLALALTVSTLREPIRQGVVRPPLPRLVGSELGANLPPFAFLSLYRLGGARLVSCNLLIAAIIIAFVFVLVRITGDFVQWLAVGLGAYSVITWAQGIELRDKPLFSLTLGCPTYILLMIGTSLANGASGAIQVWAAPYAMRTFGMTPAHTGMALGLSFAVGAVLAVVSGGWINDRWKRADARAPIWLTLIGVCVTAPCAFVMYLTRDPSIYVGAFLVFSVFSTCAIGATAALIQDLVLDRMRGTAIATMTLVNVIVGAGLGPYLSGKVSTLTGSLSMGVIGVQVLAGIAVAALLMTAVRLRGETIEGRARRAELAGEHRDADISTKPNTRTSAPANG